jgi:hypothetical protein
MPLVKDNYYYYNLLEDAVFSKDKSEVTPCYVTQMTKAYLKDGNA